MSNFLGCFFHVFGVKIFSNRIEQLHKMAFIYILFFLKKFEKVEKQVLYSDSQIWMYYIKVSYCRTGYYIKDCWISVYLLGFVKAKW